MPCEKHFRLNARAVIAAVGALFMLISVPSANAMEPKPFKCDDFLESFSSVPIRLTQAQAKELERLINSKNDVKIIRDTLNHIIQDHVDKTLAPLPDAKPGTYQTASLPQLTYENSLQPGFEVLRSLITELEKLQILFSRKWLGPLLGPRNLIRLIQTYQPFIYLGAGSGIDSMIKVQRSFFQENDSGAILGHKAEIQAPDFIPLKTRIHRLWAQLPLNPPVVIKALLVELKTFESLSSELYFMRCADLIRLRQELIQSIN